MATQDKSSPEKPFLPVKIASDDYTPLDITTKDPYGRRSMAWRHNVTNEIVSSTWLIEQDETDRPMLNFHRRWDQAYVVMFWCFRQTDSWTLKQIIGTLLFIPAFLWLGYMYLMFWGWEIWREPRPGDVAEQNEEL